MISELTLDKQTVNRGEKLSGAVTYQNQSGSPITVTKVVITTRPPGGTHAMGPYNDLLPFASPGVVNPDQKVIVISSRDFLTDDPVGAWEVYATWADETNTWFDTPSLYITVQ